MIYKFLLINKETNLWHRKLLNKKNTLGSII